MRGAGLARPSVTAPRRGIRMDHRKSPAAVRAALLSTAAWLVLARRSRGPGLPPIERTLPNGATLRFYGQINKGVLSYDDGHRHRDLLRDRQRQLEHPRSGSSYNQSFGEWSFENVNEIQYAPYSTANINILNDSPTSDDYECTNANIRKIDFTFEHDRYGKFWIGQGSMATDGIAEFDLSGTDVIGYSGVGDSAVAQIIRFSDPDLFFADNPQIGDAFHELRRPSSGARPVRHPVVQRRQRRLRLRPRPVVRRRGRARHQPVRRRAELRARVRRRSRSRPASATTATTPTTTSIWSRLGCRRSTRRPASTSPSRPAPRIRRRRQRHLLVRQARPAARFRRLGRQRRGDRLLLGRRRLPDRRRPRLRQRRKSGARRAGQPARGRYHQLRKHSWGLSLVQNIDAWNTELWLTWRSYDYSDDFASYDDGQAIFGGARFSF